jgi:UDP-N-acetylglucosamine 2-epimerase
MNRHNVSMVDACHVEGIPLIEMEHGTWSRFPAVLLRYYQLDSKKHTEAAERPFPASIAVWGAYMKDLLTGWNYPPERIVIAGYPAYDRLKDIKEAAVRSFRQKLQLSESQKLIVFMTGNPWMELYQTPQEQIQTARAIIESLPGRKDVECIIKVHQYDDPGSYRELIHELGFNDRCRVIQRCDTTLLIKASDLIIAKGSSTLLEAAIAGKPVVIVNLSSRPDIFDFKKYKIGPYISHADQMREALNKVLFDQETQKEMVDAREKLVIEWANGARGNASKNLLHLVKNLSSKR